MRWFLTLAFLFALPLIMVAQPDKLTLEKAINLAVENNPEIRKLQANLEEKRMQWRTQAGLDNPEFTYFKEGLGEGNDFDEQRIAVTQSFDFPSTAIFRHRAIKKEEKALEYELKARKRDLIAAVKKQYVQLLFSIYSKDLVIQKIDLSEELYNAAYSRNESGIGNGMELLNAEIRKAEASNDMDRADARFHEARYGLFNLIGMKIEDQKYTIQYSDTLRTNQEKINQDKALNFLEEQPEYKAASLNYDASLSKMREAKSNILPDLSLSYYKQDFGNGFDFHGFEVGVKLPLWIPLKHKGEVAMASARSQQNQWEQVRVKLQMKKEIETAWHGYEESLSTIHRFDKTIRSKANLLLDLTYEAYRIGEIDLITLLDAQQTYLRSQQTFYDALRNHYIQLIELEKYIGEEIVY